MGVVSAIIALCKAVPVLERLFLGVADGIREVKAKSRYEAKLDRIDAAVDLHRVPDDEGVEWCGGTDQPPTVSGGRNKCACMDKGRTS